MAISDSKVKFKLNDKLYTLLQTDNNSKIKIKYKNTMINIATEDEVKKSLSELQNYEGNIKIYYYLNGECISLGVKENIISDMEYILLFNNQEGFESTEGIAKESNFITLKESNIKKVVQKFIYNEITETNYDLNKNILGLDNYMGIRKAVVDLDRHILLYTDMTVKEDYDYNNTEKAGWGVNLSKKYLDEKRETYKFKNENENEYILNNTQTQMTDIGTGLSYILEE